MKCLNSRQDTRELTHHHNMAAMTHTDPVEAAGTGGMYTRGPICVGIIWK